MLLHLTHWRYLATGACYLGGIQGFPAAAEHIEVAGVRVQIIPAHSALAVEAVENAADLDYDGDPVRVITAEYLIAMYLEPSARTHTRAARAGALLDGDLDPSCQPTSCRIQRGATDPMNSAHTPEAIERLREGKRELRHARIQMPLPEKVRQVVALQRVMLPLIRRQ